jgi:hypothetical protein
MAFNDALSELERQGVQVGQLKLQFRDIIIKCLLSMHQELIQAFSQAVGAAKGPAGTLLSDSCFEIMEFKMLVDAQHKVWLIGVRQSPNFKNIDK